ncbi:MAG: energy-coupling factor ABC transporter ATP-binding protein [Bacillota bacterium]
MAEFIFELTDIHFKYPDGTRALNSLFMSIEKGKKIAVLGSNGSGKTTFFLHLNGILKPSAGALRFEGKDVDYSRKSVAELRKKVGIVFQDPDSQLFSASVEQDISFGPYNMGLSDAEVLARVEKAMAVTEIAHLRKRPTHFLSCGQKKRVSIADILAMDPQLIIFDEPTSSLDPKHSKDVVELLNDLNRQGKTVLLSTHDVDLVYSWADYVFVLNGGTVAGQGIPEDIFTNSQLLLRNDLARPWIIEVFEELCSKGWASPEDPAPRSKSELLKYIPQSDITGKTLLKKIK